MGAVIARPPFPPGPFLVLGLARSGVAAARALTGRGHSVRATDARRVGEEARAALLGMGAEVRDGEAGPDLLDGIATLVKSPGVPREAPLVAAALERGITVIGELELGWRLLENPFIALTGSNGKTTTVELIGHIHRTAGVPVTVAGNVGTALTSLPGTLDPAAVVVCEASSFQLEDTLAFAPDAAVLLNLAGRPPGPPPHVRELPRRQAGDLRPPAARQPRGRPGRLGARRRRRRRHARDLRRRR